MSIKTEINPNIGVLGGVEYQVISDRVKGFCPVVVSEPDQYRQYFRDRVLPEAIKSNPSRIIDRAIVKSEIPVPELIGQSQLSCEARVKLGGEWRDNHWVMIGWNREGRVLSGNTRLQILDLAYRAAESQYSPAKSLPDGYILECIQGRDLSSRDALYIAEIYAKSFRKYLVDLTTSENVQAWVKEQSVRPYVVRDENGNIVSVASGDCATAVLEGREFKFMELGDFATDPDHRGSGLIRALAKELISYGVQNGYDSIHAEARACWEAANYVFSKSGLRYYGTLWSNCLIVGSEDIAESADHGLIGKAKEFGSLNIWAISPDDPEWQIYRKSK